EEFGFVGCMMLLLFLAVYSTVALIVAMKAKSPTHRLVAIGCMVLLVGQALTNIGVASGALPTTGLPFPLISYGGSSMISSLVSAGILIRVAREAHGADVISMAPSAKAWASPHAPLEQSPLEQPLDRLDRSARPSTMRASRRKKEQRPRGRLRMLPTASSSTAKVTPLRSQRRRRPPAADNPSYSGSDRDDRVSVRLKKRGKGREG
ncbi:MAG: FtsW/RodA/SpoVE family cell cycle protein, partial [Cyanobacteria bacterium P01_A01_bin.114]